MNSTDQLVQSHYDIANLSDAIMAAIKNSGLDLDNLTPEELTPFDEFHLRGRNATKELAEKAGIKENMLVLDIGSGLGGPSRYLASKFGCHVTGVELNSEYCRVAETLAHKLKISDKVTYHRGSALELTFEKHSFDVVWTQHTAMNISDKTRLYAEAGRVLRPDGVFAAYDILSGANSPIYFPVPWAGDSSISFLATSEQMQTYLNKSGMEIDSWEIKTELCIEWLTDMLSKLSEKGLPPLGPHLFLGNDFQIMMNNLLKNLLEDRVTVAQIVARKI